MKKAISFVLSIILLLSILLAFDLSAYAEPTATLYSIKPSCEGVLIFDYELNLDSTPYGIGINVKTDPKEEAILDTVSQSFPKTNGRHSLSVDYKSLYKSYSRTYYFTLTLWTTQSSYRFISNTVQFTVEPPMIEHNCVIDKAVPATCETDGKTEGSHCSFCGKVFEKQETIEAKGHKFVIDKAVPATFTSPGKTSGSHCSVCKEVLVAQQRISKLGAAKLSKVKAGSKTFTANWAVVKSIDGYEIQYSLKKNMKTAKKKTVKGSAKKQLTVKKLKAKKTYYIRIRAYKTINGKKQYSAWSSVKTVKTKK